MATHKFYFIALLSTETMTRV